ncbi:MAG: hypothetical protein A2X77_02125 [Gammaproteobacteria bacterium GWE2_42_36]|nr:MAG: hypothetical protein A2X77_02125 [Gammaproteobacteria bacterium GWE2_42_36]HCU05490.1 23S rRNA pseudouridylate synthase B [Coxiellaceae bacterium]
MKTKPIAARKSAAKKSQPLLSLKRSTSSSKNEGQRRSSDRKPSASPFARKSERQSKNERATGSDRSTSHKNDGRNLSQSNPLPLPTSHFKLQKILADAGFGSRREMERLIETGSVKINGQVAKLGDRAVITDTILVQGKPVRLNLSKRCLDTQVLIYHKPTGEICTRKDPEGRPTVFDQLPSLRAGRWIVIGRLDINTSGLLLFTNNGELANKLMHPSSEYERKYAVRIMGEITPMIRQQLLRGVQLEDGLAAFKKIENAGGTGINRWYHVILTEGRNREVRRLLESQGLKVNRLMRIAFGNLTLPPQLRTGKFRALTEAEIELLMKQPSDSCKRPPRE